MELLVQLFCPISQDNLLVNWQGQKPESFAVLAVDIRNWKPGRRMDMFKIISSPENNGILHVFSSYNWTWAERKVICVDCCGLRPIGCDVNASDLIWGVFTECGVGCDEDSSAMVTGHIASDDYNKSDLSLESKKITTPVFFRDIGHSLKYSFAMFLVSIFQGKVML
ncbi:hypothetical protein V6N13_054240 [Hibiscus sabdariffa]|uniref:Uncharacterized protein n=1 Tax=Hibiscus sabdariffa TaxID=183260 RepID=A0ABR2DYE8_9ROSI